VRRFDVGNWPFYVWAVNKQILQRALAISTLFNILLGTLFLGEAQPDRGSVVWLWQRCRVDSRCARHAMDQPLRSHFPVHDLWSDSEDGTCCSVPGLAIETSSSQVAAGDGAAFYFAAPARHSRTCGLVAEGSHRCAIVASPRPQRKPPTA
jgi:hypothetical protein